MKLRNKLLIAFIVLVLIGLTVVTLYVMDDRKMIKVDETLKGSSEHVQIDPASDELTIGVIGDSWVARENLDQYIEAELIAHGIKTDVISFGHPGAKSRQILENLLSDSSNIYSSNSLLRNDLVDIIVIIAGVNDTAGYIGSDFYSHHMIELVDTINSYGKLPVILEIPEYGIEEPKPFKSALKHNFYKVLFDQNKTNVLSKYREELNSQLVSSNYEYQIIPIEPALNDYYNQLELYRENDPFHLNEQGSELLGSYIGNFISKELLNE